VPERIFSFSFFFFLQISTTISTFVISMPRIGANKLSDSVIDTKLDLFLVAIISPSVRYQFAQDRYQISTFATTDG